MLIDKSGSNIIPFEHLFLDGNGKLFRIALCKSFSFASNVIQIAKKISPEHKLELWDQAVGYKLTKIAISEKFFIDGVSIRLEKETDNVVWQYGISVTKSHTPKQRLWTLPDGLIQTPNQVITIEFDHGNNIGKWANQLIKAVRSFASSQISGVLYCFCMEKDLNVSGDLLDQGDDFTVEFKSLLNANTSGKKLGIITIPPIEWRKLPPKKNEIVDFFQDTYILNKKISKKSREVAQQLLTDLQNDFDLN
jgi:hypothetical protein